METLSRLPLEFWCYGAPATAFTLWVALWYANRRAERQKALERARLRDDYEIPAEDMAFAAFEAEEEQLRAQSRLRSIEGGAA